MNCKSKCQDCQRSVLNCRWLAQGAEVIGWNTETRIAHDGDECYELTIVKECPNYIAPAKERTSIPAFKRLAAIK